MKLLTEITAALAQCYGTTKYIKHYSGAFVFTDGVDVVREYCDAYWLIDAIASHRRTEKFQMWKLEVKDGSAVLTMRTGSKGKPKVTQEIPYTDFPLNSIEFFIEEGGYGTEDNWTDCLVLLLPSEH